MAPEKFRKTSLPLPSDKPWILLFIPLSLRWIGRIARRTAQVAAPTACYGLLLLLRPGPAGVVAPRESNASTLVYSTALGEHRQVTLPDGSKVDLNSASSIAVTFSSLARSIELTSGEALFQVNHESGRPFRVKSGRSVIEDIGTAFDVYKRPHSVLVLVVDGRIKIYRKIPAASHSDSNYARPLNGAGGSNAFPPFPPEFHKGQQIELPEDSDGSADLISNLSDADLSRLTAWRDGRVEYQGEPLVQAVEEFARYHTEKFKVADKALRKVRVGGSISTVSVEQFLLMLRIEFNIQSDKSIGPDGSTIITLTSGKPSKASDDRTKRD
jgi:transmembrane sensor